MDTNAAKEQMIKLIHNIPLAHRHSFLIEVKSLVDDLLEDVTHSNADVMINAIQDDLRTLLPLEAVLPTEQITPPVSGKNSDCNDMKTAHVDSFLYDDDTVDQLCEEGKMSKYYCEKCGSRNINSLTFISHSSSLNQLKFIFQHLLPDLDNKVVLDIGSRTGAVLYSAYYYSDAGTIFGVEINEEFCNLQQSIITKFGLHERCKVLHSDICNQADIIKTADVIVMNNVFEFFAPAELQQKIWQFLSITARKPGTLLVTSPSIEESILHLQTGINLSTWLKKIDTTQAVQKANLTIWGDANSEDSDLDDIYLYQVTDQIG